MGIAMLTEKEVETMLRPLEDLRQEHRLIERAITALERATERLECGEDVDPETLARAQAFVRGFADGCHHAKEERGLFPILATKSPTIEGGPVRVLSADHEAGRKLMRDLDHGVEAMRAGQSQGREDARKALTLYTHMLRRHIAKEEDILFPLAEGLITEEEAKRLEDHFHQVEEESGAGAHERYEAIVNDLEATLGMKQGAPTSHSH